MSLSNEPTPAVDKSTHTRLPGGIVAMGVASMCMDMSSELIHALLPIFMVTTLGASMATIGMIEGIAEAIAALVKVFSGALSDRFQRRKWLMICGYGLSAATKPLFPLAGSVAWVLFARSADRLGKGIRGAPRDALIADITPSAQRGRAFGLRQALDSVGAFLGPVSAIMFLWLFAGNVAAAMWMAVLPAVVTVIVLMLFVHEPSAGHELSDGDEGTHRQNNTLRLTAMTELGKPFWLVVGTACVFTLARCSDAFLILRAHDIGISTTQVPIVMVVMNVVYAAMAYPFGKAADRLPAKTLLTAGLLALIPAHCALALANDWTLLLAGTVLWGTHMALTHGLFAKLVADTAPAHLRGSAFGVFGFTGAIAALCASSIAGGLWNIAGASVTFFAGAGFAAIALVFVRLLKTAR